MFEAEVLVLHLTSVLHCQALYRVSLCVCNFQYQGGLQQMLLPAGQVYALHAQEVSEPRPGGQAEENSQEAGEDWTLIH